MIVGQGLLATNFTGEFEQRMDIVIFASGVSNSQERDQSAFLREQVLLEKVLQNNKKIVYFSTCSLYDPELEDSPYVLHKRAMEALIKKTSHYAIFRLPQVVGRTENAKTLTNFLYAKIMAGEHFDIWRHAKRNLIDVSDVALIAKYLINDNQADQQTTNIACPTSIAITDLIKTFELVLEKSAHYSLIEAGGAYPIETKLATSVAEQVGIYFDDTYIERVVRKYYG